MTCKKIRNLFPILALLSICASCGSGSSGGGVGSGPTITSVSVSPTGGNVQPGAQQQFSATVAGTGNFPTTVIWSVGGTSDDGNLGTISSSGLYTASANPPNPNTVTIKATSTLDSTKSGSVDVVVGSAAFQITGVTLTPTSSTVDTASSQQFMASVQGSGSFSNAVVWSVDGEIGGDASVGTISSSGLYAAPQTLPNSSSVNVSAASAIDGTWSATAQVTLKQGPPTIAQISSTTANASDSMEINGTGFVFLGGSTVTVVFPGPNGIPLSVLPDLSTSSVTQLSIVVPLSAVSGQLYVQVEAADGTVRQSNGVAFTRLPRLRIRAAQQDVSAGESVSFQSRILGSGTSETLTWSADVGTVNSSGTYTAPSTLSADSFAVVTACVQGTQICDQERLELHPFRVSPEVPVVSPGSSLQLSGIEGSSTISPTWQLNGPGTISSSGDYTALAQIAGGGGVPLVATFGSFSEQPSVSVGGAFPGIVNRVADYIDFNQIPFSLGTFAVNVGVTGNTAYVEATNQQDFVLQQNYYWVDVYDISDPTHPTWKDAFEPSARGQMLSCNDGYLYQIAPTDYSAGSPFPGILAVYDITGPHAVLKSRQISPVASPVISSQNNCLFTQISLNSWEEAGTGGPAVIDQLVLQNGNIVHNQFSLSLPQISAPTVNGLNSTANRAYALVNSDLIVYDLTTQPPPEIGMVQAATPFTSDLAIFGNLLFVPNADLEEPASQVFDISAAQPVLVGTLPIGSALTSTGSAVVAGTGQTGLQIVDVSNPQQPTATGAVFDYVDAQYTVAATGNYVLSTEGEGGLAVYDISKPGGLLPSFLEAPSGQVPGAPAFAQAANATNLYFAIANSVYGSGLLSYDLSTSPPTPVGSFSTGSSACQALALSGHYLYLGAVDALQVLDVSNPAAPSLVGSINNGISALTLSGSVLFAGTVDGRLVTYDISTPSNPVQQASLTLPGLPVEFAIAANLLLVADSTGGLLIYNVATPSSPVLLGQVIPSTAVTDVTVDGNLALLAAWDAGLMIVDFSNPASPKVLAQAKLDTIDPYQTGQSFLLNKAATIATFGKVAFIGVYNADTNDPPENGNGMIYGFDYSDAMYPRLVYLGANGVIADAILTLRPVGNYLIAGGTSSLIEFDAAQPRNTINLFFPQSALRPPSSLVSIHRTSHRQPRRYEPEKGTSPKLPTWRKYGHR